MNINKPVDYSTMFAALDVLMVADQTQMELYCEIGRLVSERPERGAAIAAAEYLNGVYHVASGFSPRNLRRMRDFYRAYESAPVVMAKAMAIGWTQNVVILEAELTVQERVWYIQAASQFKWSKLELQRMIAANAHMEISLDITDSVCYTEEKVEADEISGYVKVQNSQCHGTGNSGSANGLPAVFCLLRPQFLYRRIYPQSLLVRGKYRQLVEVARRGMVAYGKLFSKKAGLVSREWYPDLANYRRNGYDFDSRYEEGLASYREKCIMDVLLREGPTLSKDLKRLAGFGGDGLKGFDTVITNLQMQTYVTVHSFEYARDKYGKPYGWGIARYAVTEDVLGAEVTQGAYDRSPEESKARIIQHLGMLCPDAFDDDLMKLIR